MVEKMINEINKEIEKTKKHYELRGWDETHGKNICRVEGMIKMLEVVTGKSYTFNENGVKECLN